MDGGEILHEFFVNYPYMPINYWDRVNLRAAEVLGDVNFELASFELAVHLILRKFVAAQNRVCGQECHH